MTLTAILDDGFGAMVGRADWKGTAMVQPLEQVSFDRPDEVREGENWRLELAISRAMFRWAGSRFNRDGGGLRT